MLTYDIVLLLQQLNILVPIHRVARVRVQEYALGIMRHSSDAEYAIHGLYEIVNKNADIMSYAIRGGHFNIVKILPIPNTTNLLKIALQYQYLHIAKWICEHTHNILDLDDSYNLMTNLPVLMWFYAIFNIKFNMKHIQLAASYPDTVKWIVSQAPNKYILRGIAQYCGFEMFMWAKDFIRPNKKIIDCGDIRIIDWMLSNFKISKCTINFIVTNNHLEIAKYLHSRITIKCKHINIALENKHYEIVQWLDTNNIYKLSENNVISAIKKQQHDVVEWFAQNRPDLIRAHHIDLCQIDDAYIICSAYPDLLDTHLRTRIIDLYNN